MINKTACGLHFAATSLVLFGKQVPLAERDLEADGRLPPRAIPGLNRAPALHEMARASRHFRKERVSTLMHGDSWPTLPVTGLNQPFTIDLIMKDRILDVCIDNRHQTNPVIGHFGLGID